MDKKIANNMIVGVVFAAGFTVFVFLLFNISGGTGIFSSQYSLLAKFRHVKGLHSGSEVSLSGLRIGVVKSIKVADTSEKELTVELAISKSMQDKVRQDSVASIRTQGVLGDKYVEVSIGTPQSPVLKHGDSIVSDEPADLFSKGGDLVEDIKRQFEKGGDFESLMKNLNTVAGNLAVITTDIRKEKGLLNEVVYGKSGPKLSSAVGHFSEILRKINEGDGSLGALINDPTVYEDLKSLLGGAKRSNILKYFMRSFIESGNEKAEPAKK